jgi:phosphoglycolate phosphatase-like HAD superfamily hydrolase
MKPDMILWDYDGTLVNSVPKNIDITKQILTDIVPRLSGENLPIHLKSEEEYHIANHKAKNWQDLYVNYYGLTEIETQLAGSLWTKYQLKNLTPVELFPEIKQAINQLNMPHGICSQNSAENIRQLLAKNELLEKFHAIVGYDDIPNNKQKPLAFGGIKCINKIFKAPTNKTILYIGDHEGDVEFARNIASELNQNNTIISVIVTYSGANTETWTFKPDFEIAFPSQLLKIVN